MGRTEVRASLVELGYLFAAFFSAWASYRIHVLPIEQAALPILEALVNLEGRAPDQYRLLPYLLIGGLAKVLSIVPGTLPDLRVAVLIFDSLWLWLSAMLLLRTFRYSINPNIIWTLFLIYPFLMFDGYRPISSFILFLSICTIASMKAARRGNRTLYLGFIGIIAILSFSRADVALLFSIASVGYLKNRLIEKAFIVAVPVVAQGLLSQVIFPDAEYFSAVVMLWINISGEFLIRSPVTYLLVGALLVFWRDLWPVIMHSVRYQIFACLAVLGYVSALLIIAMPNEFRLFLPLLPLYLWLLEDLNEVNHSPLPKKGRG